MYRRWGQKGLPLQQEMGEAQIHVPWFLLYQKYRAAVICLVPVRRMGEGGGNRPEQTKFPILPPFCAQTMVSDIFLLSLPQSRPLLSAQ